MTVARLTPVVRSGWNSLRAAAMASLVGGDESGELDRFGRLVPADGPALFDDVQIQRTPHGILQRADRSEASVDVGWEHG